MKKSFQRPSNRPAGSTVNIASSTNNPNGNQRQTGLPCNGSTFAGRNQCQPTAAASSKATTCPQSAGQSTSNRATPKANPRVSGAVQKRVPIFHTASATTTTASHFRPVTTPPCSHSGSAAAYMASSAINKKDGKVKPTKAANAPATPPRTRPMAKPNWLDAGPGRNWVRASKRAKSASLTHCSCNTKRW